MEIRRRELLEGIVAAGVLGGCAGPQIASGGAAQAAGVATPASASSAASSSAPTSAARPKRILVLGGTGFAGPPIVEAARRRGHTVTMFNRGKTDPGLFPDVETILGDRLTQLDLLRGRSWDAVVDTWAPGPTLVTRAAELLRDQVGHYVFLSTISVYAIGRQPIDESSPVLSLPPGVEVKDIKKVDETTYGPVKVLAEQAAERVMPGRSTSIRSGLIAGPRDQSARFTYWPIRVARGGEMIAPGVPDDRMQFIDVRDLGEWMVTVVEQGTMGVYNAVGPEKPLFGAILDEVRAGVPSDVRVTWVDQPWLAANKAGGWGDFPAAVSSNDDEAGFARVSAARAIAKGLRFRAPRETASAALAWWRTQPDEARAKAPGITPEREAELLRHWHEARG